MSIIPERKALFFFFRVVVGVFSVLLVYGIGITLVRSVAWWIRVFDFPRVRIAVLLVVMLAGYAALRVWGPLGPWEYALAAAVVLALAWQIIVIVPYTTFYPKEMLDSRAEHDPDRVSLLIYNVLYDNREVAALHDLILETGPDIVLLSETTQWWLDQLDGLEDDYPHTLLQPQGNNYGLLLYSRLELEDPEIRFLIDPEVPSFRTGLRLRSGTVVTLYGLHPRPPGLRPPDEDEGEADASDDEEREDSDTRDAELLVVSKELSELGDVPAIVASDLNDVAWSYTTHRFQRIGGLLDPRVGRGIFNTFHTKSFFMRFPLDHVFASQHSLLAELRRLPDIGSDHFPLLVVLDYDPGASDEHEEPQPEPGEEQEADEAIEEGKSDD